MTTNDQAAMNEQLTQLRLQGLSIDGDNRYKQDLIDAVIGAMMFGAQGANPPPAGHWLEQFYVIGREERQALARVEAERDDIAKSRDQAITDWNQAVDQRDAAQAQLAEAVGVLKKLQPWMTRLAERNGDGDLAEAALLDDFLARHAQAGQQEAQGAQAGDELIALLERELDRERERADMAEVELQHARAALATQPAAVDPIQVEAVAITREDEDGLYLDWVLEGGISALESPGVVLLVAHGTVTDDQGSGEVYLTPPVSAHGDQVVAVVGTVPDGSGFKSLDFKVELESLPDGTRLYAQGAGGAST